MYEIIIKYQKHKNPSILQSNTVLHELVKHRFPIKDFGNDEFFNILMLQVLFYYGESYT